MEWMIFLEEARAFHKTARGALMRPEIFTPSLIQNIAAMSIEKYFMAMFSCRNKLPYNHTMADFIEGMKEIEIIPEKLEQNLRRFDELQSICSFSDFYITDPEPEDIDRFMDTLECVAAMASRITGEDCV